MDTQFCAGCQRGDDNIKSVSWCSDCSELVCKTCARVHARMFPPHKVLPMKEIQQVSLSLLKLSKNCENHPDQKIILYCRQHDKVICSSCVPASHHNCRSIISIEKAAMSVKEGTAITDLERRIENLSQVTDIILSQNETTLENLSKGRNNIKEQVSKFKNKVIAHLNKLEADIHNQIYCKYNQLNETISKTKESIKSSAYLFSEWKSDLKSLKQHTSEIHLFQAIKFLDAKTHQKEIEIREIQNVKVPTLTYLPPEFKSNIKKIIPDLGTIMVEHAEVPMPVLDIDQQGQVLIRANEDQKKLSLTNSFQTKILGYGVKIYRSCFIPGEKVLLVKFGGRSLFVCKFDGSEMKVIDLVDVPQSIALYDNNNAVVALGSDGFQIIKLPSLKLCKKIPVDGFCGGITIVKDKIWIRNTPNTLTIVDIYGRVFNTIKTSFDPYDDICANRDGDVYYTDGKSNKVYVVTSNGKEHEMYNSSDLKSALGLAVDNRGDVYVAGNTSHNIHRISKDGHNHDIVLKVDDGINIPTGLSYDSKTNKLLLINSDSESINIYQIQ